MSALAQAGKEVFPPIRSVEELMMPRYTDQSGTFYPMQSQRILTPDVP